MTRKRALEVGFPFEMIDRIAEVESHRKELNRPIYHVHKWWANRLGSVFRAILIAAAEDEDQSVEARFHATAEPRDFVVLDPFMGSGTTVGEALKLGMKAIGCDINPISSFAVRQALRPIDPDVLVAAFEELKRRVADRIRSMYVTRDRETGAAIPVLYAFWVKEVVVPNGERVPLFKNYVFSSNAQPGKNPLARILCPACGGITTGRFDAARIDCGECGHHFDPGLGPCDGTCVVDSSGHRHKIKELVQASQGPPEHRMYALLALRENGEKVYLVPDADDRALHARCVDELRTRESPLPTLKVRPGHNTNQARGYNYLEWRHFFNDRQLLALSTLLDGILKIEDRSVREQFLCLFSGTLEFNNMFCSFKGEGTGAVRHMFSHHILKPERTPLENSVWGTERSSGTFSTLFKSRLLRAQDYLRRPFELEAVRIGTKLKSKKVYSSRAIDPARARLLTGDSASLPLPNESVDAVVTDPPYFDFVHYSELSDFFFAWLSPVLRSDLPEFDRPDSSHRAEVQDRDPASFAEKLGRVFGECHRVLRAEGLLAFTFHHSKPEGWAAVHGSIVAAGFVVVAAHPIKAEMSVGNPKTGAKEPIDLDAILVCRKREATVPSLDVEASIIRDCEAWIARFDAIDRRLSRNDRFVIAASQVLRHASLAGLDEAATRALLDAAHSRAAAASKPGIAIVALTK